jgi:hypothetical protein
MIWNKKTHKQASPQGPADSVSEQDQPNITSTARKNLVKLISETASGMSTTVKSKQQGILCLLGDATEPSAEARFDHFGLVRDLAVSKAGVSLFRQPFSGDMVAHAQAYIAQPTVQKAFKLNYASLVAQQPVEFDFGTRVGFKQFVNVKTRDGVQAYPVRGGQFNVFITPEGQTTYVGSTVRHGEKPRQLGKIITEAEAVAAARANSSITDATLVKVSFEFSAHEGKLDPVYAVTLTNVHMLGNEDESVVVDTKPVAEPSYVEILIHAKTGAFLHAEDQLRHSQTNKKQRVLNNPLAKVFLRVPDYKVDVLKQIFQTRLEDMPDAKVLKDIVFKMFILDNSRWQLVKPDANGGYEFNEGTDQFSAVVAYFALSEMRKRFEKLGFRVVRTPIPVKVNDPQTPDNAFMVPDLNQPEMHIGVGTGVEGGGLTKMIVYCIDVEWHELFHWLITIQTPGNDLTGADGAAMHEGLADIGAWLMGWLFLLDHASVLGVKVTRQDIANDLRTIGEFCMPPNGIRQQKNHKTTKQKTGEPHDDGEIIGGAVSDFFAEFITNSKGELVDAIEACVKMMAQMLAVMPAKRPLFTDALRGLISADLNENKGANRATIEKSFKDHLIVLSAGNTPAKKRKRKKQTVGA